MSSDDDRYAAKLKARLTGGAEVQVYPANSAPSAQLVASLETDERYKAKMAAHEKSAKEARSAALAGESKIAVKAEVAADVAAEQPTLVAPESEAKPEDRGNRNERNGRR